MIDNSRLPILVVGTYVQQSLQMMLHPQPGVVPGESQLIQLLRDADSHALDPLILLQVAADPGRGQDL